MADIQMVVGVDYSELTGLVKTGEQTKRVLSSAAKDFARTGNQKQYMHAISKIVVAQKQLDVASQLTRKQIMKLGAEMQREIKFTDALAASTNRLGGAMGASKNRMNGNNMAIQQLGYQFGDFAVQVQGGTSAFVAFSQQGAQLAGILPMVAGPLGISMGLAVGLSAAFGILIPIGSAIARMFFEMKDGADEAKDSLLSLADAQEALSKSASTYQNKIKMLEFGVDTEAEAVALQNLVQLRKDLLAEQSKQGEGSFTISKKSREDQDTAVANIEKSIAKTEELVEANARVRAEYEIQAALQKSAADLVERSKKAEIDKIKAIVKAFKEAADARKKAKEDQEEATKSARDELDLMRERNRLLKLELGYGKDSLVYKATSNQYEEDALRKKLELENVDEIVIQLQIQHLITQREITDEIGEQVNEAKKLAAAYKSAISEASKIKPNFAGVLDPRGESGSIVDAMRQGYEFPSDNDKPDKAPSKKSQAETDAETIASFQTKLDLETELLGKTEARQKVLQALGVDLAARAPKDAARMEAQIAETNELIAVEQRRQALVDSINGSIEDGFMAMSDGTKSVSDAFRTMAAEIVRELYKVYVMQVAIKALKLAMGIPFADGGVISGGSEVKAYANGGVVGGPTTFPMAGGKTGLMGEAGPEAIMPLKRGANGKLGVQMEGGGDTYVTNNYSISANTSEDTKRLVTQTIQQAQPALTQAAKASIMNDRRRGGQMKSVFG